MTRYVIGPHVAIHLAHDEAVIRDEHQILASALLRSQMLSLLYQAVLGPDHRVTLGARANPALWTGRAGDPAGARDQYAALLPVDERVLGPDHPHTLTARASLTYWTKCSSP